MSYHLFGDFPSPIVIGALSTSIGIFWAMLVGCAWLIWAVLLWNFAWFLMVRDKAGVIIDYEGRRKAKTGRKGKAMSLTA
jgi:hypothetical protein